MFITVFIAHRGEETFMTHTAKTVEPFTQDEIDSQIKFHMAHTSHEGVTSFEALQGADAKRFLWDNEYNRLDSFQQWLIAMVTPEVEASDKAEIKSPEKILAIVRARLESKGLTATCTRCGGTGSYSYNQRDGTKCFKCNGLKTIMPRDSKKFRKQIEMEYTPGK